MENYELLLTESQLRALAETLFEAGYHKRDRRSKKGEAIILWNNLESEAMRYKFSALDVNNHAQIEKGTLPKFAVLEDDDRVLTFQKGAQIVQGRITIDNWLDSLTDRVRPQQIGDLTATVCFQVQGENGRTATLVLQDGRGTLLDAHQAAPDATISADSADWLALINGQETPDTLFVQGRIKLSGDLELLFKLAGAFDIVPPGKYQWDSWRLAIDYMDLLRCQLP